MLGSFYLPTQLDLQRMSKDVNDLSSLQSTCVEIPKLYK